MSCFFVTKTNPTVEENLQWELECPFDSYGTSSALQISKLRAVLNHWCQTWKLMEKEGRNGGTDIIVMTISATIWHWSQSLPLSFTLSYSASTTMFSSIASFLPSSLHIEHASAQKPLQFSQDDPGSEDEQDDMQESRTPQPLNQPQPMSKSREKAFNEVTLLLSPFTSIKTIRVELHNC